MERPTVIDLFSGCGGMSLGLEAAGFNIVASVEIDPIHNLVHHFNFPYGVSLCEDISNVSSKELLKAVEKKGFSSDIDLIAGGPPCQGFSHIGKRQLDDPRNSLVFEYVRIIKEVKPKYFIFENVPGIASGEHKKFLQELIVEFENIGYSITKPVSILDAALYGSPQKRKRVIILGSRADVNKVLYPEPTHSEVNLNQLSLFNFELLPIPTCENAIGDLLLHPIFINYDTGIDSSQLDYTKFRTSFSLKPSGEFKLCHRRIVPKRVYGHLGSKHSKKSIDSFQSTISGTVEKTSRFFKLAANGQCNTLRAGTGTDKGAYTAPRPIHYAIPRCISVREAARLHTYPDWFRFHNTIWHGFREIGNSVIPLFSKSLGDKIVNAMGLNSTHFEIYTLEKQDETVLNYNIKEALNYWHISNNLIPKRTRFNKNVA